MRRLENSPGIEAMQCHILHVACSFVAAIIIILFEITSRIYKRKCSKQNKQSISFTIFSVLYIVTFVIYRLVYITIQQLNGLSYSLENHAFTSTTIFSLFLFLAYFVNTSPFATFPSYFKSRNQIVPISTIQTTQV